jgi:hypothetical protein
VAVDVVVQEVPMTVRVAKDLSDEMAVNMPVLGALSLILVFLSFFCEGRSLLGDVDCLLGDLADLSVETVAVSSDSEEGGDVCDDVTTSACS